MKANCGQSLSKLQVSREKFQKGPNHIFKQEISFFLLSNIWNIAHFSFCYSQPVWMIRIWTLFNSYKRLLPNSSSRWLSLTLRRKLIRANFNVWSNYQHYPLLFVKALAKHPKLLRLALHATHWNIWKLWQKSRCSKCIYVRHIMVKIQYNSSWNDHRTKRTLPILLIHA